MNTVVLGLSYGDEGKGHIIDLLTLTHDATVKYCGSCNTGATVVVNGNKFKFNHIPVGIIHNKPSFIAGPCYINTKKLLDEMRNLRELGYDVDNLLKISPDCNIITQDHIDRDCNAESGSCGVGSTKQGVSPAASDKYGRKGIRIETCKEFERYFVDVSYELNKMIGDGKSILFGSSQATLLDIEHGLNYPYISTTSNVSGAACSACGIGPTKITDVVGVTKAYTTKVSSVGFPTKLEAGCAEDNLLVDRGYEYGTVSGRRRQTGWLDLVALRYAVNINGCTSLALTKSDVLIGITAKYCVAYELDGKVIDRVPVCKSDYWRVKPIYEEIDVKTGREFIKIVEEYTGIPVKYFSFGPERSQIEEL